MVDNAPSVGIVRCSKNPVDAREKNIQQRAKSLSLAGASTTSSKAERRKRGKRATGKKARPPSKEVERRQLLPVRQERLNWVAPPVSEQ